MPAKSQNSGCLALLSKLFGAKVAKPPAPAPLPYGKRDHFLSPAEISFYHVLKGVITDDTTLICKVRLSDLFYVKRPHENRGARNKIDRKHVDFVLCRANTMEPVLGIELDDKSHQRKDRQERDAFVDAVFAEAGLPLLHIPAAKGYVPNEIAAKVSASLG
jgi:very-short-patch-repair endonuclease